MPAKEELERIDKAYFDWRFDSFREVCHQRHAGLDHALSLAACSLDKRLETMNEFRGAINDQAGHFLTRNEYHLAHEKLAGDISVLREFKAAIEGKASQASMIVVAILSVISILVSLVGLFFKR